MGLRSIAAKAAGLRSDLDAQQVKTFTKWWNSWLIEAKHKVTDLCAEIRPDPPQARPGEAQNLSSGTARGERSSRAAWPKNCW